MEHEDAPHEQALFDERVTEVLRWADNIPISTAELNDGLFQMTGSDLLVPVVTGISYDDIAKWSTEIESEDLNIVMNAWYSDVYFPVGNSIAHRAVTNLFCDNGQLSYLSTYFINRFRSSSLNEKRKAYPYFKHVAINECRKSMKEFYILLEGYGAVDVLAYDNDCPFELRKHALYAAAISLCAEPHSSDFSSVKYRTVNTIVECLAIVYARRSYTNYIEIIDAIIHAHFGEGTIPGNRQHYASVLASHIVDDTDALGHKGILFDYYKDTIVLALRILEELYDINLIMLGASKLLESVQD